MKSQISVSIIINNYNYDCFLSDAINSALEQTYPDVEVVVVDDGSTDKSREVIAKYGDRILPIFQSNGKQAAAFNNGFANSKGDIIIFLDSDDYLFPYAVERIVSLWSSQLSKIHYRLQVVNTVGQSLGFSSPQGTSPLSEGKVWKNILDKGVYISTPTSGNALNRNVLEKLLPIPDAYKLTADDYLSFQVPFYGNVVAIEEPLGAYRIHDSNQWALSTVTAKKFQRFVRHDLQNFALIIQKAQEFGYEYPPDLDQRSIGRLWSRIISLRLDPLEHPITEDRILNLIYEGIRSLWKYSDFNWQKRFIYSIWFLWVGLLPLPLATPAITWLYAPQYRPKFIDWTVSKIRLLN
jgi:glycosyltransferase involved in cell wall biosynthesis